MLGLFPANSIDDDDVEVYADDSRARVIERLHFLRQQKGKAEGQPHSCLADFVAPKAKALDYIGAFAVTTGLGIEPHVARFEAAHDDYNAILLRALADRLAEALAERLHEARAARVLGLRAGRAARERATYPRRVSWHTPGAGLSRVPGSHRKATIWRLLDVERNTGMRLTESFAMYPTAAVSGLYFSHPDASYFAVGKIDLDQVQSYAVRRGISLQEAQRWLAPNLG